MIYLFIYFWLCWVFIALCGLSLAAVSGGLLLPAVHELLMAAPSLAAECCAWAHGLSSSLDLGSSRTRQWTYVLRIGRRSLIHCTTSGVLLYLLDELTPLSLYNNLPCLFFLSLKSVLSGISIATHAVFWFSLAWNIFFHLFTWKWCVSLKEVNFL